MLTFGDDLVREYPRSGFADELAKTNIREWAEESVQVSLKTVYRNLDPEIATFADLPVGYEADVTRAALVGRYSLGTGWRMC